MPHADPAPAAHRSTEAVLKIAITGSSGFVGGHLARHLAAGGHRIVPVSRRTGIDIADATALAAAFDGCDAVAHCAGINREIGRQTYQAVHVDGTRRVVDAAVRAGVPRVAFMSFLRARPDCGSKYHESKWTAEEIVRGAPLEYTIIKAGMTYGLGDHMLDHLSHGLHTLPIFATVGIVERPIRPLPVEDLVRVLGAAVAGRLPRTNVAVVGAEELLLSDAVRRVARVIGRRVVVVPSPVALQYALAQIFEWTMTVPLVAKAQVRMLEEGVVEPATPCDPLPADLAPRQRFTDDVIRAGLPAPGPFGLQDLRACAHRVSR